MSGLKELVAIATKVDRSIQEGGRGSAPREEY